MGQAGLVVRFSPGRQRLDARHKNAGRQRPLLSPPLAQITGVDAMAISNATHTTTATIHYY